MPVQCIDKLEILAMAPIHTVNSGKIPPQPQDYQDGTFDPIVHDRPISNEVMEITLGADDTLTASITGGSSFFKVLGVEKYELLLDQLPHGPGHTPGPIYFWTQEKVGESNGVVPLSVAKGQRVHVNVTAQVAQNALPPGPFSGTLALRGGSLSRTVPLQGIYLAVDEQSPIGQKWKQMGGEARLGDVLTNAHPAPDGRDTVQEFTNGTLYDAPGSGVFYLSSAVYAKWMSPSVAEAKTATGQIVRDYLGLPTGDTFATPEGGEASRFNNGLIVVRPDRSAWVVYGAIFTLYNGFGNLADKTHLPFLGYPLSDEVALQDGIGRCNHFDGGSIYWTPATGAHEVHGAIRDEWASLGWQAGFLGYPLTDEVALQDGIGRCNHFQGGSIYWTPNTGAHEVHGAIRDEWTSLGWQAGFLGYPLTDEVALQDGIGRCNHFQGGSIYWTPDTGAHEVHGAIRDKWISLGWQLGYLGYPTSDEGPWTNPSNLRPGRISSFQWGQIGWTSQDGAMDIPDTAFFHGDVVTPSGTALGGYVDMTMRSDGSFSVYFHMHDSGIPDYDFQVSAILAASNGMTFAIQHSGHVEGSDSWSLFHETLKRDDDYTENGSNHFIQVYWPQVRGGNLWVTKDYSATGVVGFVEDLGKAVLDIGAGAVAGTVGVVIGLGSEIGQYFGNMGIGGTFGVIAGVVVFATGGGLVMAVVAGAAVGAITNDMIQQRPLSPQESQIASQVFGGALPSASQIMLTNLNGVGGRPFTVPGVDGNIYINLGDAFSDPLNYTSPSYPVGGQTLIHELTHAWQIAHTSFLPGWVCDGVVNQANKAVGQSVYVYGPPGPPWSDFNLEAQGAIVDQWFGGIPTPVVPNRKPMDPNDPYFLYIANNVQAGRT
jgi:uncharacterized protein with LGFP repeats